LSDQGDFLEGAEVHLYSQVYDLVTHSYPVFHDFTGAGGTLSLLSLAANAYNYKVSASGYLNKAGRLTVSANRARDSLATTEEVMPEPQAITMVWVVEETTIEYVYEISLHISYDPTVTTPPVPEPGEPPPPPVLQPLVLYIDPHLISVKHELEQPLPITKSFTLKNLGEITAEDITIEWPETDRFAVKLNTFGEVLPAAVADGLQPGESVEIPYVLEMGSNVELCGVYEEMFRVTGSFTYADSESQGSVETYGQFRAINRDCNHGTEFESSRQATYGARGMARTRRTNRWQAVSISTV
jgi:hypothetical protein